MFRAVIPPVSGLAFVPSGTTSREEFSMGRQYEASERVEFFTEPGTPRAATKRLAKKFSNKVSHKFDAWSTKHEGYVLPEDTDMRKNPSKRRR